MDTGVILTNHMTDPIADLLTRIRNGYGAHQDEVRVPFSKVKAKISEVLSAHRYLDGVTVTGEGKAKELVIKLKYVGRSPVVTHLERISSPGRRMYVNVKAITPVLGGNGMTIISTNKGIMIDTEAKSQNLGGEIICKVW